MKWLQLLRSALRNAASASPYKEDNIDFSQGLTYESDEEEKGAKPAKKRKNDSKQKDTEKDSEIAGLYKKRKAEPKAKGNVSRR